MGEPASRSDRGPTQDVQALCTDIDRAIRNAEAGKPGWSREVAEISRVANEIAERAAQSGHADLAAALATAGATIQRAARFSNTRAVEALREAFARLCQVK